MMCEIALATCVFAQKTPSIVSVYSDLKSEYLEYMDL